MVRGLLLLLAGTILAGLAPSAVPHRLAEELSNARVALTQGDAPRALVALESALRLEPSLTQLHRPAAQAALVSLNPGDALTHIDLALAADPDDQDLACLRLEAMTERGDSVGWDSIPPACQGSARLPWLRAQALLADGEFERALGELEQAANRPSPDPEALHLRALLSAALRPQVALAAVLDARRAGVDGPLLADLESVLRSLAGASEFEAAMRTGQALLNHGRSQEASLAFERAAALRPTDVGALAYLAFAATSLDPQNFDRLRAIRLESPGVTLPYLLEAVALRQAGNPSSAIPVLAAALDLDPANPALLAEMAAAQLSAGDLPEAGRGYRRAAEAASTDAAYWRLLAQFSLDHGVDPAGLAFPAARNAVALDPASAEAWDLLGQAHLLEGDALLADRLLRISIRLDPGLPAAHYHLGQARLALADPAGARSAFEAVLRIDAEGEYADLARRSLETLAG